VADGIEVYTRGIFSKQTVSTIVAPSGSFIQTVVIPVSNPFLPAPARAQFCANNDFNPNVPGIQTITPAECAAAATATSTADPNFRAFTTNLARRTTELGPRLSDYTTTYFDYRAGVRVDITDTIDLDISGSYGESENRQSQQNYLLISRLRTSVYTTSATTCNLGASPTIPNPNPLLPPLAAPGASPNAATGCVPVNIFGPEGSITPAMTPYLTANATNAQLASLAQARALFSGDFGTSTPWASDPIGFAVGGEFRRYTAAQTADALSQTAGELGGAGGAVQNYNGAYDVYEAYGELIAPIVQDRPFFHSLTLEAGIRYSAYTVKAPGEPSYNTTTWKLGGNWEPVSGLRFRGNYQRAVRAPNINELFAPVNVGLTSLPTEPCVGAAPLTNANLRAVCLLQGAPAASIGTIPAPSAAQANATTAGGLYLRPETADSYTFGVVFQPDFVPGLSISVDYYHIVIEDAISQPAVSDVIANCFGNITAASVNNPACLLFRRNPVTGDLAGDPATVGGVVFISSNSGRILTDGVDLAINYRRDLGFARMNLAFNGNWTHRSQFQAVVPGSIIPPGYPGAGTAFPSTAVRECVGFYSPNCGSPGSAGPNSAPGSIQPEFTWNARATLTFPNNIDLSVLWRHIDDMQAEPGFTTYSGPLRGGGALNGVVVNTGVIPAFDYFDFATRFGVSDNFDLTLTVFNVFDKQPPIVGASIGSTSFNSGNTYPSTYDVLGRRYAVGARLRF